jgi:hypothetical protein
MKFAKALLTGLAVLSFSAAAHAQTVVRLTGSTAFRSATHNAIRNILASGHTYGYTGTSLGSAGQAIFTGTVSGNPVIIKTAWSGSVGGTQTVSQSIAIPFLPNSTTQSTGGTSGATTATSGNGGDVSIPDIGMADTYQNATPFTSPSLVDVLVGIQPFKWMVSRGLSQVALSVDTVNGSNVYSTASTASLAVGMTVTGTNIPTASKIGAILSGTQFTLVDANVGVSANKNAATTATGNAAVAVAAAPVNNLTPQLAQALFANGKLPLALFTGNAADETSFVWATGRDPDSGTRLTAFAESGVGVNSTVVQYQPTISSGAVTSHVPWPQTVVNGITFSTGNGGYSSGGTLASTLASTTSAINGYYISYVSTGDAATAINGGAKELSYNGIYYSLSGVQEGSYPFWCYEHVTYRSSLTGVGLTVATNLANQIINTDSPILLSTMKVGRSQDGGLITPNY